MEGKMLMARGIEGIQFTGERRSEEEELERFYERRLVQVKIINELTAQHLDHSHAHACVPAPIGARSGLPALHR